MKIDKLSPSLCLGFQISDGPYPVDIMFGNIREFAILTKEEISNISMWNECSSIDIVNVIKDRRWRTRGGVDRREKRNDNTSNVPIRYSAANIKAIVEPRIDKLFEKWAVGRPDNWICDIRTKYIVCIGYWLNEEMIKLKFDDLGRITQLGQFNRYSRSDEDSWELAAKIMNDVLDNKIERNRKTHRRWG